MKSMTFALLAALAIGSTQMAVAAERAKPVPAGAQLKLKAPPAAKPDFVIQHASAIGGSDTQFMVKIKNAGAVNSPGALLQASNATGVAPGNATDPYLPIKAGQFIWVKVELNKPARKGDRILLFADHNNAVAEIKETNNKYAFNW